VKDGPGGLRDYNVAYWLALISAMEKLRTWPDPKTLLPVSSRRPLEDALDFQMSCDASSTSGTAVTTIIELGGAR